MSTASAIKPIHCLKPGDCAVIEEVRACEAECHRLASMGFGVGCLVRMLMPGSPCAVQVGDCRVMLRGEHLDAIHVSLI